MSAFDKVSVLTVSLDSTFLEGSDTVAGNTIQRVRYYSQILNRYDVLVYTPNGLNIPRTDISPRVQVHPVRYRYKWWYPISAYQTGMKVCKDRKPDLIHTQDVFATGLVGYMLKRRLGLPVIYGFHGDMLENPAWLNERKLNRVYGRLGMWLLSRGDGYRVVSRSEREKLVKLGVPEDRIWYLPPLNDFEGFVGADGTAMRQEFIDRRGFSKIVMFAGRLVEQKDLGTLIRAMAIVRKRLDERVVLVLVGDGPKKDELVQLSGKLGLVDSTFFAGRQKHENMPGYFAAADVFALSSTYEGNAKVMAEAAACGIPVVATDISGTRDTVVDGETGYVVPPGNPEAFADRLLRVLNNPKERDSMGNAGRKRVLDLYGPDAQLDGFREMWETTVRRHVATRR